MWIFTKYGFYSVVCGRSKSGQIDTNTMMIRARDKSHLQRLCGRFKLDANIRHTTDTDYAYRIIIAKAAWTSVASDLAGEIDYGNFKSEVSECEGSTDYQIALHDVWDVMFQLQIK